MSVGRIQAYKTQIEAKIGPSEYELAHQWTQGSAELWKVRNPDVTYALKVHVFAVKYAQERWAYENWTSKLEASLQVAPQLEASFAGEPGALMLSWIDGEISSKMNTERELDIYADAGRCLARLHAIDTGSLDVARHRTTTRDKTIQRVLQLRELLGERVRRWALETTESVGWDKLDVGYCHRDYSPRNWMVSIRDTGCRVTVIDFEFAALDYRVTDMMKLWDGPFKGNEARRQSFYLGYGRSEEQYVEGIRLLATSHGLAIMAWSQSVGDHEYLRHGKAFLERCSEDVDWMFA